jgi:cytochrome P450
MRAFQQDRLALYQRVARECGDVAQVHFGPFPLVIFNTPELAHAVLVEHDQDFDKGLTLHRAFTPVAGQGLINNEGESWRRQRKLMAPAFAHRQIATYADIMTAYTERAQAGWAEGAELRIDQEMMRLTMSIVGKALFDADVLEESDELGAAVTVAMSYLQYAITHIFPLPLSIPTPRSRQTRAAMALIDRRLAAMIAERRASGVERGDLLSLLLAARDETGAGMSDRQLRDEAITLFLAGHETTANSLSWCWYLLAQHPALYARLQQEVDTVLAGRAPTFADLPNLPYALQVFKEAMRLYPPADGVTRTALRDVEIGGYHLRKNTIIAIPIYTIHRRPEFYPDPERFDPDRFLPENEKRLPRHAFMPFGAGPRICIGNQFALMEGQLVLAALAQRVTFALAPGQEVVPAPLFVVRQKNGCRVIVHRRAA